MEKEEREKEEREKEEEGGKKMKVKRRRKGGVQIMILIENSILAIIRFARSIWSGFSSDLTLLGDEGEREGEGMSGREGVPFILFTYCI
jgi:hypothetical protein